MSTVTISQGTLQGGKCTTENRFQYYEFLGIPYAKPPLGELRFKSPQPPEPWNGVRDATTTDAASICCQLDYRTGSIAGSEDCLYLNVYTPTIAATTSELKPVMVLSHGGGFVTGNGIIKEESGPDYLIENEVVIVTFNYRLGPLGFLCLEVPEAAGNMGLKDHVMALQWVKINIHKFGGDANNVTIFGVSAGSAACEFLTLSPRAKGLFHKCILQSGSSLNGWAINFPNKAKMIAFKLAQELGYAGPDDNISAMYKILFAASALDLTQAAFKITQMDTSPRIFFGFVPVIEQDFGNGDVFLKDTPYSILKTGEFNEVPMIRGFCNKEGLLTSFLKPNSIKELLEKQNFTDYWNHYLEDCDVSRYNPELITAYMYNSGTNNAPEESAINFFGDLYFAAGICIASKLQSKKVPLYMYKFCYDGKLNSFKLMFNLTSAGTAHGDDVGYIFGHFSVASQVVEESDLLLRTQMTRMWTNFARTGNPTPDGCSDFKIKWPRFTVNSKEFLNINKDFTIEANYEPKKLSIFEPITHKYEQYKNIYQSGPVELDINWDNHSP